MQMRKLDPNDISIDPMNERTSDVEVSEDFVQNVEDVGVVQPPIVREMEEDADHSYGVVVGQRRVRAAQEAGLDELYVFLADWSDEEAIKASITENMDLFRNRVPPQDRAQALKTLWEMMGGSGMPVQSHLGNELGVPRETVRTWLEPLHEGWKDTTIDPESDESSDAVDELGERSLAEIRRMTGGGEEGEAVAERAAELEMTQPEIQEAKELVEDEDMDPMDAIEEVGADDEDDSESTRIEVNEVKFDPETSEALKQASDDMDSPPAALILNAVDWFLEEEGYL